MRVLFGAAGIVVLTLALRPGMAGYRVKSACARIDPDGSSRSDLPGRSRGLPQHQRLRIMQASTRMGSRVLRRN